MSSLSRLIKRSVLISSLLVIAQQLILISFSVQTSTGFGAGANHFANNSLSNLSQSSNRSILEWLSAIDWMSGAETIMMLSVLIALISYVVLDVFHQGPTTNSLPWKTTTSMDNRLALETNLLREECSPCASQLRYHQAAKALANASRSEMAA